MAKQQYQKSYCREVFLAISTSNNMYPTYYTYNPSRMRKAEKAYFKQGKTSKINDKNYSCAKLHIKKLIINIELQLCNGSLESKCTSLYHNQILNVRFTSSSKCILLVLLLSYINVSQSRIFVKCNRLIQMIMIHSARIIKFIFQFT